MGLAQSCEDPLLNYRAVKAGAMKMCFCPWKVFHGRTAPAEELFHVAGTSRGRLSQMAQQHGIFITGMKYHAQAMDFSVF